MNKIAALFFMTLFLSCMLTHSSRPEPSFQKESMVATQKLDVDAVDKICEEIEEEECLMRRTLVAHTDYIYTQKHNP
ncbi:putative phytosulfokine [Medicago truncatula]|uniref:Phytosulfokine n=1 Tax=Medicago truncatula TaxID=3880 RepID=G7K2F1_MEDTR|nr:phytosulfokines [Medicago truncatula]AES94502.1 phytosulfokine precursor protein [Medicago truncatula]RHN53903.1 putative phytosulfokine [Medicago truncatula]